jgi:sensor c-di-GMP phosphodiesterase-like protein
MREAERQREEAVQYAQNVTQQKQEMEGRLSKIDNSYVSEFESRVKTGLAAAKLALKNAIESQDVEAQIAAQQQLAALTMDEARVNSIKVANEQKPKAQERQVNITPQQQRAPQPQSDPRAEDWASRNSWFGNDSAMTYTAFDIHKKLVEQEGFDPQSNDYYAEVDKRIRLEFPHKFDKVEGNTTERARPAQNVASARRSATTGRRKTVKLSPSQVAIAKRLGVPLEDYAKQLKITEGV